MKIKPCFKSITARLLSALLLGIICFLGWRAATTSAVAATGETRPRRVMEDLGRGVVAISRTDDVFVSWRLLGTEPQDTAFNVYRITAGGEPVLLNEQPLVGGTNLVDAAADRSQENAYLVRAVLNGVEQPDESRPFALPANARPYAPIEIPLKHREHYMAHFAWVGDLTGDGEYEVVVTRLLHNHPDPTATQKVEAYRLDGTLLWVVDMGPLSSNPEGRRWRASPATIAHGQNDHVTVFDMNIDGRAEVIIQTARGVIFGDGRVIDEGDDIQQFISVVDGLSGAELARSPVPRDFEHDGPVAGHFGIAYLDGVRPSFVYKTKNRRYDRSRPHYRGWNLMVNAWSFDGNELSHVWQWVRPLDGRFSDYQQIRVIDVNGDGRDEVVDGGYALSPDGTPLWSLEGAGHGDRFHIGKFDPDRPGLQGFAVQQRHPGGLLFFYYDAATGEMLRRHYGESRPGPDVGRGTVADIDPNHRGLEYWSSVVSIEGASGVFNAVTGERISESNPRPNLRIWWDGDAGSEIFDITSIEKWDPVERQAARLVDFADFGAIRNWRGAPIFYGDILGDWREEVVFEHQERNRLLIFTTPHPTDIRLYTLPHNPAYRAGMTVKGYMQSHMVDYFLGFGMEPPPAPHITTPSRNR